MLKFNGFLITSERFWIREMANTHLQFSAFYWVIFGFQDSLRVAAGKI